MPHNVTAAACPARLRRPFGVRAAACALLGLALALRVTLNLFDAVGLRHRYADCPYEACFAAGMVDVVDAVRHRGATRVFGPHHDVSPYVFHRFNEMLYPVRYYTPVDTNGLVRGAAYILVPGEPPPVPSRLLAEAGLFRLLEAAR